MHITAMSFIHFGWQTFKKRPWFLIGGIVATSLFSQAASFLGGQVTSLFAAGNMLVIGNLLGMIIAFAGSMLAWMGMIAFVLRAHDHVHALTFATLWHPKYLLKFAGLYVLLSVIVGIGFLLFVVPGVVASIIFGFAPYIVVDKGYGPLQALKESARITYGNRWRLLALYGMVMLLLTLGALAFVVGILVAIPVAALAQVAAYRTYDEKELRHSSLTTGEKIAAVGCILAQVLIIGAALYASLYTTSNPSVVLGDQARLGAADDLNEMQNAIESYYETHREYPATLQVLLANTTPVTSAILRAIPFDDFAYTVKDKNANYVLCTLNDVPSDVYPCVGSKSN